jgi:hypothetical protein
VINKHIRFCKESALSRKGFSSEPLVKVTSLNSLQTNIIVYCGVSMQLALTGVIFGDPIILSRNLVELYIKYLH